MKLTSQSNPEASAERIDVIQAGALVRRSRDADVKARTAGQVTPGGTLITDLAARTLLPSVERNMIGRADDRNTGARLASADAATPAQRPGEGAPAADLALVKRLLAGDEATFTHLVERYHGRLLRLARLFVANHAVAEEVVQDTWLAVLKGLPAFEGRSALKSWMFTILTNLAKTRAIREKRSIPFSALSRPGIEEEPTVQPDRFTSRGAWSAPPRRWDDDTPEQLLLRREALALVEQTIAGLPPTQRAVVTLRDVDGLDAAEVCAILELSEANQRVLLHRARSKVRSVLERHLTSGQDPLDGPPASRPRSAANSCSS